MIRRLLDFVFVLLFVWIFMIIGFWILNTIIVPLKIPGNTYIIFTAILKVGISTIMVLFWLWLWRTIVTKIFWRIMNNK